MAAAQPFASRSSSDCRADEAILQRVGDRPIIEPVHRRGVIDLLRTTKPLDEDLPGIDDPPPATETMP